MRFLVLFFALVTVTCAKEISTYMIGNKVQDHADAPFMASLRWYGDHICGAVMISDSWFLTAAKCVREENGYPRSPLSIREGSKHKAENGQVYNVIRRHISTLFGENKSYELALLKIRTSKQKPIGKPIVLSNEKMLAPDFDVKIYGWGRTDDSAYYSDNMQEADIVTFSQNSCNTCDKKLLCAGAEKLGPCKGDEGGALTYKDEDNNDVVTLAGIAMTVSENCTRPFKPTIYVNIGNEEISQWIRSKTGLLAPTTPKPPCSYENYLRCYDD